MDLEMDLDPNFLAGTVGTAGGVDRVIGNGVNNSVNNVVVNAMAGIADLDDVPVAEHVARFDAVHRALSEALATLDEA